MDEQIVDDSPSSPREHMHRHHGQHQHHSARERGRYGKAAEVSKLPTDANSRMEQTDINQGGNSTPLIGAESDAAKEGGAKDDEYEASKEIQSDEDEEKEEASLASSLSDSHKRESGNGHSSSPRESTRHVAAGDGGSVVDEELTQAQSRSAGSQEDMELTHEMKKEEIGELLRWLRKHCADITESHLESYSVIFHHEHITSAKRLGRKVSKDPACLTQWGIHEVDAEDIILALHEAKLTMGNDESGTSHHSHHRKSHHDHHMHGRSGNEATSESLTPHSALTESPMGKLALDLGFGGAGIIDFYMPENADEFVYMVPIKKSARHTWGPEVVGLCAIIFGGGQPGFHDVDVWCFGRILSYDKLKKVHVFVTRDANMFEIDLHLYKIRLEMSSQTVRRSSK